MAVVGESRQSIVHRIMCAQSVAFDPPPPSPSSTRASLPCSLGTRAGCPCGRFVRETAQRVANNLHVDPIWSDRVVRSGETVELGAARVARALPASLPRSHTPLNLVFWSSSDSSRLARAAIYHVSARGLSAWLIPSYFPNAETPTTFNDRADKCGWSALLPRQCSGDRACALAAVASVAQSTRSHLSCCWPVMSKRSARRHHRVLIFR
jgi:hypothetical protein